PLFYFCRHLFAFFRCFGDLCHQTDIILYTISGDKIRDLLTLPGWSQMKAVKNNDIYPVKSAYVLIPGPRIIDGIEYMSDIFEQWSLRQ
ncbi:hypothetical protein Q4S08_18390, partial [Morganella morganii]